MKGKSLPRLLQHSFQGRCQRVLVRLDHFDPDLFFGDGELQLVAKIGDTGDVQLVDVIGKGRVEAEAGPCDPGKAGACQQWEQRVATKERSFVGSVTSAGSTASYIPDAPPITPCLCGQKESLVYAKDLQANPKHTDEACGKELLGP